MENITHSLVGATLAELALPPAATVAQRRLFFITGIVAANLPDADLLYTRITEVPLGYLLHHRGHTHTLVGLIGQALLIGLIALVPPVRRRIGGLRLRFSVLVATALLSHIVLDSWNSYGVHPFWPFDNRWIYGDAIFIAEPWLWALLGVAVTMNARSSLARGVVGALLAVLTVAVTWFGVISGAALAALAIAATASVFAMRRMTPHVRSFAALTATSAFVIAMFVVSHVVEQRARASLSVTPDARVMDAVLNPQPANPLCWTALVVVKNERAGEYVMTRATVSLAEFARCGSDERGGVVWNQPVRQSLSTLRRMVHDDCRVRAWMQFGRAPVIDKESITDIRFGGTGRGNFTAMPLANASEGCPAHLTSWGMPRADLLE